MNKLCKFYLLSEYSLSSVICNPAAFRERVPVCYGGTVSREDTMSYFIPAVSEENCTRPKNVNLFFHIPLVIMNSHENRSRENTDRFVHSLLRFSQKRGSGVAPKPPVSIMEIVILSPALLTSCLI